MEQTDVFALCDHRDLRKLIAAYAHDRPDLLIDPRIRPRTPHFHPAKAATLLATHSSPCTRCPYFSAC